MDKIETIKNYKTVKLNKILCNNKYTKLISAALFNSAQ